MVRGLSFDDWLGHVSIVRRVSCWSGHLWWRSTTFSTMVPWAPSVGNRKKAFLMYDSWCCQEILSFHSYRNTHCRSHEEDNLVDVVLTYCGTFIGIENSSSQKSAKNTNVVPKITQRITVASDQTIWHKQERSSTSLTWVCMPWRRDFQIRNTCPCCVLCSVITMCSWLGYTGRINDSNSRIRRRCELRSMYFGFCLDWLKYICTNGQVHCVMAFISVTPRENLFFGWRK